MKIVKNKLFYVLSGFMYLLLIFVFALLSFIFLERDAYSFLVSNFAAVRQGSGNIVEIIVDDRSVQENGKNWSRSEYAEILDFFHKYTKPAVIGFDTTVSTYDPSKPEDVKLISQVAKMDNLVSGFLPEYTPDDSDISFMPNFEKKFALNIETSVNTPKAYFNGIKTSSDILQTNTKHYGSVLINTSNVSNSMLNASNIVKINDAFYPSLALKMFLLNNKTNDVSFDSENIIINKLNLKFPYKYGRNGIFESNIRFYTVNENGYSYPSIPAYIILDTYRALNSGITPQNSPELFKPGKYINPDNFKDLVVFIGANISGPSADVIVTPMAKRHPGVDIQAVTYDNLQSGYFLRTCGAGVFFLSLILLSLLAFIFILKTKFIKGLVAIALLDAVFLFITALSAVNGYIISYAVPLVCQFVTVVFGYSFKFISENRNKEKIKQAMGKYLSQDVMKNVVSNIDDLKLGGKRAVVTVLFSDIRGFTSLSEKMSAEEVSVILNEYFSEMEPIITKYNGVINKFIGDAVMALFGEPIQDINHAQNAVKCAYEMLKKVEYLREKWLFEGKPRIEIGVGINTGEVFIGNIGTETRMEYTVIGDTVNLASRIEGYNKVYKTNLLVSSSTYEHIAEIADVIKISEVQIRGKAKKMDIYEVLRIDR